MLGLAFFSQHAQIVWRKIALENLRESDRILFTSIFHTKTFINTCIMDRLRTPVKMASFCDVHTKKKFTKINNVTTFSTLDVKLWWMHKCAFPFIIGDVPVFTMNRSLSVNVKKLFSYSCHQWNYSDKPQMEISSFCRISFLGFIWLRKP